MELEKHRKEISAKQTLKEKLTLHPTHGQQFGKRDIQVTSPLSFLSTERVPSGESGTRPLTFTFVPSIGQLPTHFQVVDVCELVRTSEEPNNESSQEIINRSTVGSDNLALKSGIRQDSESTYHTGTSQKIFWPKGYKTSKGEMQESDLFKAEFVFITDSDEGEEETVSRNDVQQPSVGHGTGHARCQLLATSRISSGGESSKPHGDLNVPETQCAVLSHSATRSPKQHQALEEPIKTEKVIEDTTLDTHSEMCSPAQLRQKTEELCAAIDQVLQDPLPMRRCESSPSSLHTSTDSDIGKISATLQRAAGRETRYANLYLPTPSVTESQLTKPGVIRPGPMKTKILLKTEEPYQPNPFKKYLEETRDPDIEQDNAPLHPLYPTKLIPPTKSQLHPQSICHADCLTPGPFSHLSSILCDVHESSYRPYSHNALYNKPSHPIVSIPENEALSSKEFHSVAAPSKLDLPPTCESKKTSKGKLPASESPLCSERFSLRVDMTDTPAKTS
ncbi:muscular LMNA-interacting protein isoform X9 [Mauremys reevesii]|uniref:muscular LMNA-interacting protein isoform X9 n=1 Tax=Mauremys reevesii TaxID=260615 RepID=UPI00194000E4|nr:muscular LMNA-interacting protein isoform X9 [Mauremys reevesii]